MLETQKSVKQEADYVLKDEQRHILDRLGAALSMLCALHCALQPLLLASLPLLGLGFLLNEQIESIFLGFSVLLALWSLSVGMRHHGQKWLYLPWLFSAFLIVLSRLWEAAEMSLAVAGALGIVGCHLLNLFFDRQHQHA